MPADEQSASLGANPGLAVAGAEKLRAAQAPPRGPVYGARFAIATDHATASLVGMNVLQRGGSAVDAAIAAAAVNVVVKPYATHLGGDAFVLIWHRSADAVECLNAGGRASRRATLDEFADGVPPLGARASTVPGLVDAWTELHKRHGSLPLPDVLQPAIELCERGFPASMHLAAQMAALETGTADEPDATIRQVFLKDGRQRYRRGETLRQPELAETLAAIAQDGRDGFYGGRVGRVIADAMRAQGGLIDEEDLSELAAHWHEPLAVSYKGCTVYEQALPSQGLILLMALNIVEHFPLGDWGPTSADSVHVMVEAVRLAFADVRRHAADPLLETVPVERLLSKEHAQARAAEIDLSHARARAPALAGGDTTSFVVADEDTAVCFIQSIYHPWGSRFVVPGTGIMMNNRMLGFSTDPRHPNCLAPRKRTVHTLNNFLVTRDGALVVGGGTPGADFQVQTNLQTIVSALDWGFDLHSAINAPRWVVQADGRLAMEGRVSESMSQDLEARGHDVARVAPWDTAMSRSQVVASLPLQRSDAGARLSGVEPDMATSSTSRSRSRRFSGSSNGGWAAASDLRGEGAALAI